jgi:hypothetical protein
MRIDFVSLTLHLLVLQYQVGGVSIWVRVCVLIFRWREIEAGYSTWYILEYEDGM